MSTKPRIDLIVTDLDNTVWDWFEAWFQSFTALLQGLHEATGLPKAELEAAIRPVHQRRGTSEYSWLIEELAVLEQFVPEGSDLRTHFDDALHRQNRARKESTRLYPGVLETMGAAKRAGVPIVAYTESLEFWTNWRVQHTRLDGLLDRIYSSPDHDAPAGLDVASMRTLPADRYTLDATEHRRVPPGVVKPSPQILEQILAEYEVDASRSVYIGDSLMKDVAMAQAVGAIDVYAGYGDSHLDERYAQLQRVSHWPDLAVEKEQDKSEGAHPTPTHVLANGFDDLLNFVVLGG